MKDESEDLAVELQETFAAELDERLESMNRTLLALERGAPKVMRRDLLQSLFRDAHSLKGGAQLIGLNALAALAHALEARLDAVRTEADERAIALQPLFGAVDAMAPLGADGSLPGPELRRIVEELASDPTPASSERPSGRGEEVPAAAADEEPDSAAQEPSRVPQQPGVAGPGSVVRVPAERLDVLISRTGDLIAARDAADGQAQRLRNLARELAGQQQRWSDLRAAARHARLSVAPGPLRRLAEDVEASADAVVRVERETRGVAIEAGIAAHGMSQLVGELNAELRDLRMVPVSRLFRQFPGMVRDLGEALGKPVQLRAVGWDTTIDRDLLERLKDPVMHLLRNAVDHGIEAPATRQRHAKPDLGTVFLEARRDGDRVVIEVRDDGGGIDRERVLHRAAETGLGLREGEPGRDAALGLIFRAGFSTIKDPSEVSGRGVGLDVVGSQVAALGGSIGVRSGASGTTFALRLPLTLLSTRVLVVRAGGHRFALPIEGVERVFRFRPADVVSVGGRQTTVIDGRPLVLADLGSALGLGSASVADGRPLIGLVVVTADAAVAFVAEGIEGEREVLVRELGRPMGRTPLVAGAALVERDEVLLVLDESGLAAWAVEAPAAALEQRESVRAAAARAERRLRVLVADDSITTRTLEKNILAAAGFDVALAVDGREALRRIRLEPFDLLVSDVDMPELDGVELTERLRADERTRGLPVILVTAKEHPEDRERGLRAGADAYVLKSEFDHHALLNTIREVVG